MSTGNPSARHITENLATFFQDSDNPAELKRMLLHAAEDDPDFCFKLLRQGFEETYAAKCEQNVNEGIVAALIISVLLAMAIEPPDAIEVDDFWTESRETMHGLYMYLCLLGTMMALAATFFSLYWVNISRMYVVDVDRFIWWCCNQKIRSMEVCVMGSLLCCALAMGVGFVVVTRDPLATVGLCTCLVIMLIVITFTVHRIRLARNHFKQGISCRSSKLVSLIEMASENVAAPSPEGALSAKSETVVSDTVAALAPDGELSSKSEAVASDKVAALEPDGELSSKSEAVASDKVVALEPDGELSAKRVRQRMIIQL
eukprot:TRINITY_DN17588_c0_g1_i4.p2 TRINITY_DN17588_c0_g1~~TRINITY_DN17588_c0_g1_i4.p2  ORF type:complete len:351 (+),score=56.05 TRINITY_DN17588_c0_g1_i4:108-1055(+)